MKKPASVEEAIRQHYQERCDAALLELIRAREKGEPVERIQLLTQAFDRLWRAASYVRKDTDVRAG